MDSFGLAAEFRLADFATVLANACSRQTGILINKFSVPDLIQRKVRAVLTG